MPAKPPGAERRGRRRRALLLPLFLLLLLAGHVGVWFWAVGRLEAGFAAWAGARRAEGWTVAHGPPGRSGWPGAAALRLPGLRIETPTGAAWQAEGPVTLALAPPELDRLRADLAGRHRIRLEDGERLALAADRLDIRLPIRATGPGGAACGAGRAALPPWATAEAAGLRLGPEGGGGASIGQARLALESRPEAGRGEAALALRLTLEALDLPPGGGGMAVATLGPRVGDAALDLSVTGPLPPAPASAARVRAWRDAGGSVRLREARLRWGPAAANLEGWLVLDRALQPAGEGRIRLAGAAAMLDAAAAAGLLAPGAAGLARGVLPLLERPPPSGGGPPEIEAPVALDRGTVSVARLPLLRLPAWTWP